MTTYATVTGLMPLRVTLDGATTQQPAGNLGAVMPALENRVVVTVLPDGQAYILGPK